jgi:hypothetical protein
MRRSWEVQALRKTNSSVLKILQRIFSMLSPLLWKINHSLEIVPMMQYNTLDLKSNNSLQASMVEWLNHQRKMLKNCLMVGVLMEKVQCLVKDLEFVRRVIRLQALEYKDKVISLNLNLVSNQTPKTSLWKIQMLTLMSWMKIRNQWFRIWHSYHQGNNTKLT